MKCIIVDDEATARIIMEEVCGNFPELEIVAQFPNAIEALKFLGKNEIEVIFLDIHMPDFTGFDFIETIKI